MVNVTWLRWQVYLAEQQRDEQENAGEAIPYEVCECPPRGTEES